MITRFSNSTVASWSSNFGVSIGDAAREVNLLQKIELLYAHYKSSIEQVKSSAPTREKEGSHLKCFYNGKLSREIRASGSTLFICRCDGGYLGENCELERSLYDSIQSKVIKMLDDLHKALASNWKVNKNQFIDQMIAIAGFNLGRKVVFKMLSVVQAALATHKEQYHRKKLFRLYDQLLLHASDLLYKIRQDLPSGILVDVGGDREFEKINKLIDRIIVQIESSLEETSILNSFIDDELSSSHVMHLRGYILNEFKLKTIKEKESFGFFNPSIDDAFNLHQMSRLYIAQSLGMTFDSSPYNIQVLNFASSFFESRIAGFGHYPASNIVYIKYIHPKNFRKAISHEELGIKSIQIGFALNFIPAFEDILKSVKCVAYNFNDTKQVLLGNAVDFDEASAVLKCEFYAYFSFTNFYFAAAIPKSSSS
jgi:hypothetical protein